MLNTFPNFKKTLAFIATHTKQKKIWLIIFLILSIYLAAGRLIPIVFGLSIDYGVLEKSQNTFVKYIAAFAAVCILRSIAGFTLYYLVGREGSRITYDVRKSIYSHTLWLKVKFFDTNPSGKTLTKVTNDTRNFQSLLGEGLIGIFINSFELISIFIALAFESTRLCVVLLVTFPITILISKLITKKISTAYFSLKETISNLNTNLADSLNGFEVIKSYGLKESKFEQFSKIAQTYFSKQIRISYLFARLWPQVEFLQLVSVLLCFVYGSYLMQENLLRPGSLVAFTLLIQSIFQPLRFVLERMNQIQNGITSTIRLNSLLKEESEEPQGPLVNLEGLGNGIKIENLSFSYSADNPVLKNLNLTIPENTTTAIIGRTGSGKTTLVSLLQKFYKPQTGQICIGGEDLENVSTQSLRKILCVVRQEDFVFQGSLQENISLEPLEKTDLKKVQKALDFSGIDKSPDFKIDSSGLNLSLGERQLLSFARIHYHAPKILIFDEATSFIDEETEAILQEKSKELFTGRNVLIIAHKQSTIELCDQVIELDPIK